MSEMDITSCFNDIYETTNRSVLIYITSKCNNTADIPDILQETYMELYKVLNTKGTDYIMNKHAFVLKLAKQKIYRHYTLFEKIKMQVPILYHNDDGEEYNLADIAVDEISMDERLFAKDKVRLVQEYLSDKPVEIRKIFQMYYSLDMTISEIAVELGLKESNIKNKIFRTVKEIKVLISEKEGVLK